MVSQRDVRALERGSAVSAVGFEVFRAHPTLLVFPVVSLAASALGLLALLEYGTLLVTVVLSVLLSRLGTEVGLGAFTVLAAYGSFGVLVALGTLTVGASNAALARATQRHIEGEPVRVRDALAGVWRAKWTLLALALLNGLVGVVLVVLERKFDSLGDLVASVLGLAYGAVTFFVLPAAVVDGAGPVAAFRRSATLLRRGFGDVAFVSLGVVRYVLLPFSVPFALSQVLVISDMALGTHFMDFLFEHTLLLGGPIVLLLGAGFVFGFNAAAVVKTAVYIDLETASTVSMVASRREALASAFRTREESSTAS